MAMQIPLSPPSAPPLKRGFVRVLFGEPHQRLLDEINFCLQSPILGEFTTYVLGQDNYDRLRRLGARCVLVNSKSMVHPTQTYRNRLRCLEVAAKDYDEMVALDWNCYPTRRLPPDFWDRLSTKARFQAPLVRYRAGLAHWRPPNRSRCLLPNGGWLYFRQPPIIIEDMEHLWDSSRAGQLDEVVYARWTDNQLGDQLPWVRPIQPSLEIYYKHFEPLFVNLTRTSITYYLPDLLRDKDPIFKHELLPAKIS